MYSFKVCQEFGTRPNDTEYGQFWTVTDMEQNRRFADVRLNVYVQASREARLRLSSVPHASAHSSAPYYELVLGTGGDHSEYELQRSTHRLDRTSRKDLLSPQTSVHVEITIKIGEIRFGFCFYLLVY